MVRAFKQSRRYACKSKPTNLLATNIEIAFDHFVCFEESIQNTEGDRSSCNSFTVMSSLTVKTAAVSSNLGSEISSCGARLDLDDIRMQETHNATLVIYRMQETHNAVSGNGCICKIMQFASLHVTV